MKKRLLSLALALILVLSLLPVSAVPESQQAGHVHCLCGEQTTLGVACENCGQKAVEWTGTDAMPTTDGYYYLTADVSASAQYLNNNEKISLCLNGHHATSAVGKRFFYLNKNVVYNISDCTAAVVENVYTAGSFSGASGVDTYGSTMRVNAGCVLNLYDGIITGNTAKDSGIIYVDGSANAATAAGTFNMYGGEVSGNTCLRGTVYGVSNGTNKPVIRILGGTITGNTATGTGSQIGGGGVCAFSPVEVGGDAKIYGNTATKGPADILLRNDGTFTGSLVISSEVPLKDGAQIACGLQTAEPDTSNLKYISGAPDTWDTAWLTLDGEPVNFANGKFFHGDAPAPEEPGSHIHCLCGDEIVAGKLCASCGSKAVEWTESGVIPTATGYYYLSGDVSTAAVIPANNSHVAICLHGNSITSAAGKKIAYLQNGATLTFTDCSENVGTITGCKNDYVVQAMVGTTLNLYNGKITGNTTTGDGIISLGQGNATTDGAAFHMYGGEISGNTAKRGTVMTAVATGSNKTPIVRILGGIITGNHATGTSLTAGGGAGVLAMCPIEVGGDAKIYGNTAAAGPADIYLRNDQKGALIISADKPLTDGAQIHVGLYVAEADPTDLKTVSGAPAQWQNTWLTLDGSAVGYADGKFFMTAVEAHIHCLCGAETDLDEACENCGSKAVVWTSSDVMPTAEGYYYLNTDMTTAPAVINGGIHTAVCLNGHTVTSAAGRKIAYIAGDSTLSFTDCAEEPGSLTGVTSDSTLQVAAGSMLNLYGGKITGNVNPNGNPDEGIIRLDYGTATKNGGGFQMFGGEISGNTSVRGTIMTTLATGERKTQVIRILGGTITGNHATGTAVTTGGGAGILSFAPVEIGGDAKIYGNTAAAGEANLFLRNDQKASLVISSEKPLTDGANVVAGLYAGETDLFDLKSVTGAPETWGTSWVTLNGKPLRYEEGKFAIGVKLVYSNHVHDSKQWISVVQDNEMIPELTGNYVLDGNVTLPREMKIAEGQNVVLCLNGHTLTAAAGVRHFEVQPGGTLTICDCTAVTAKDGTYTAGSITGADGEAGGGSIRVRPGATVNLYGGKITGNHTTGEGGAFYLEGCTAALTTPAVLNMYGGEISNNKTDKGFGGAIRFAGVAEGLSAATFHMEGGTIKDHASPNYGGALHAPSFATIELLGGVIENNTAVAGGGAVSVNGLTTVTLDGTIIRNNSATKWGGGIYLKTGATMVMKSGEVSGNSSKIGAGILLENEGTTLTMTGGKISKNKAGAAGGGGVYVGAKTAMVMAGGEICSNTSQAGGAGISCVTGTVEMNGGSICHNTAQSWGAGCLVSTDAKFTMNGGSINNNYTPKSAAGVYLWCSEMVINKGSIKDNIAKDVVGGIRVTGAKLIMNGGSVTGNEGQTGSGAGIMGEHASRKIDGVKQNVPAEIIMKGGTISYNKAAKAGSGVIIQNKNSTFTMYGGTISYNHAGKFAGAVYVGKGAFFNMHGGEVCYNTMEADGTAGVYHDGGGNHTGGSIHHNTTPKSGAGFAVSGQDNVVYAKNLKIYENSAKVAGGVLVQSRGTLHMEDCEIWGNTSTMYGAGVYLYTYVTMTMKNCKIHDNTAQEDGGGIWTWATSHITLDGCEIVGNKALEGEGGGIWTRGDSMTILNSLIQGNSAVGNGGGIFAGMMGSATKGHVDYIQMENTTLQNNTSGKLGGGMYLSRGSKAKLNDVQILNNTAAAEGGALWAVEDLSMHSVTITENTSGSEGYAVYLADSGYDGYSFFSGLMKMSGSMKIHDNQGGDLYLGEKVPVIIEDGLGEDARIELAMHSGLLTQWVWGAYNYEGGNQVYTITCGDRSVTDPEVMEAVQEETEPVETTEPTDATEPVDSQGNENTLIYAGVGAFIVVIAAAAVIIILANVKKKKAEKAAAENTDK